MIHMNSIDSHILMSGWRMNVMILAIIPYDHPGIHGMGMYNKQKTFIRRNS